MEGGMERSSSGADPHHPTPTDTWLPDRRYALLWFYAFYEQDLELVQSTLLSILVTKQITGNIKEALLPYISNIVKLRWGAVKGPAYRRRESAASPISMPAVESQALLADYGDDDVFDDYLEMVIQFG